MPPEAGDGLAQGGVVVLGLEQHQGQGDQGRVDAVAVGDPFGGQDRVEEVSGQKIRKGQALDLSTLTA